MSDAELNETAAVLHTILFANETLHELTTVGRAFFFLYTLWRLLSQSSFGAHANDRNPKSAKSVEYFDDFYTIPLAR